MGFDELEVEFVEGFDGECHNSSGGHLNINNNTMGYLTSWPFYPIIYK